MFRDRMDAAGQLADRLAAYRKRRDAVVLAIPRGGVQVGYVLSRSLALPLDILLIKKIGHPHNPEFAVGSVSLSRASINQEALDRYAIPRQYVAAEIRRIRRDLRKRYELYRGGEKPISIRGKIAIITDDGVATGNTLFAAVDLARREGAKAIVVAVPVAPRHALKALEKAADEVVCLEAPEEFSAVGAFYEKFDPVEDNEAMRLLKEANSTENLPA